MKSKLHKAVWLVINKKEKFTSQRLFSEQVAVVTYPARCKDSKRGYCRTVPSLQRTHFISNLRLPTVRYLKKILNQKSQNFSNRLIKELKTN